MAKPPSSRGTLPQIDGRLASAIPRHDPTWEFLRMAREPIRQLDLRLKLSPGTVPGLFNPHRAEHACDDNPDSGLGHMLPHADSAPKAKLPSRQRLAPPTLGCWEESVRVKLVHIAVDSAVMRHGSRAGIHE
ncbi:unnamed protein product [Clonostachys byssicola]|uniref:Uncharacterized protein n=1 Tax=Clonostachys byssicola TaxID=160290 RepID=A0A9N9Y462_9HYPO|nr:unnamed protein product [Clonostachys byssicola]